MAEKNDKFTTFMSLVRKPTPRAYVNALHYSMRSDVILVLFDRLLGIGCPVDATVVAAVRGYDAINDGVRVLLLQKIARDYPNLV